MIGTHMNGGVILMALPADDDYYVILHVRMSNWANEYATGLVHVSQLPKPREWWSGHYFHDDRDGAVLDLVKRSVLWDLDPGGNDVDALRLKRMSGLVAATERLFRSEEHDDTTPRDH